MLAGEFSIVHLIGVEFHSSQYDFIDGFARHMRDALPRASFIGFTGTPIEKTDANTRAVFGDYISIYDIQRAVEDGATVPIYYESRLARLELKEEERPRLDEDFEEATEGEELEHKEKLKTKWAALEALVGAEQRGTARRADCPGPREPLRAPAPGRSGFRSWTWASGSCSTTCGMNATSSAGWRATWLAVVCPKGGGQPWGCSCG